jgi:hypothetical protein
MHGGPHMRFVTEGKVIDRCDELFEGVILLLVAIKMGHEQGFVDLCQIHNVKPEILDSARSWLF